MTRLARNAARPSAVRWDMRTLVFAAAILLAACASTADPDAPTEIEARLADIRTGERVERICFSRGIDGFRDNGDRTVIVRRRLDEDYLLVMRSCPQLDRAQSLVIAEGGCLRRNDRIIVSESAFGSRGPAQIGPATCFVDAIYRWDEAALEIAPTAD